MFSQCRATAVIHPGGLPWADGDGMGRLLPQPSDNLSQAAVSVLEPKTRRGHSLLAEVLWISPPVHSLSSDGRQSIVKLRR